MSEKKNSEDTLIVKVPLISVEIVMSKRDYEGITKFLLFIVGYLITTFVHLMNMIGNSGGEFYSFMISDSLIKSIPEGFIVGIILFNYKKILNFKIIK